MRWPRRLGETLNEKLLRESGLDRASDVAPDEPVDPLSGIGPAGEAGITGIARARRWHATATAEAPDLKADEVDFVTLPDGTIIVEGDEGDASVTPLAEAIERSLKPPYRARAVRHGVETWGIGANPIEVAELPDQEGDEIDVASRDGTRTLLVDGARTFGSVPRLEALGSARAPDYVVHAERLDGDLWEVRVAAL
jgi:hypothetical protein